MYKTKYKFPKRYRISRIQGFNEIIKQPVVKTEFLLIQGLQNFESHGRLGISISKKKAPKAVVRNFLKRLIRESYRKSATAQQPMDVLVRIKKIPNADELKRFTFALNSMLHKFQTR